MGPPEHDRTGMRAEESATVHPQILGPGQGQFDQRLFIDSQEEPARRSLPEMTVTFPVGPTFVRLAALFDEHKSIGDVPVSIHSQREVLQAFGQFLLAD